jgi:hypothetical protein
VLVVDVAPGDTVRIALERDGAPVQVRQQRRRDPRVVVERLRLREAGLRVEHVELLGDRAWWPSSPAGGTHALHEASEEPERLPVGPVR